MKFWASHMTSSSLLPYCKKQSGPCALEKLLKLLHLPSTAASCQQPQWLQQQQPCLAELDPCVLRPPLPHRKALGLLHLGDPMQNTEVRRVGVDGKSQCVTDAFLLSRGGLSPLQGQKRGCHPASHAQLHTTDPACLWAGAASGSCCLTMGHVLLLPSTLMCH